MLAYFGYILECVRQVIVYTNDSAEMTQKRIDQVDGDYDRLFKSNDESEDETVQYLKFWRMMELEVNVFVA